VHFAKDVHNLNQTLTDRSGIFTIKRIDLEHSRYTPRLPRRLGKPIQDQNRQYAVGLSLLCQSISFASIESGRLYKIQRAGARGRNGQSWSEVDGVPTPSPPGRGLEALELQRGLWSGHSHGSHWEHQRFQTPTWWRRGRFMAASQPHRVFTYCRYKEWSCHS